MNKEEVLRHFYNKLFPYELYIFSVQLFDMTSDWSLQSVFVEWTARLSQRLLNNGAEAGRRVSRPPQCARPEVEL